MPVAGGRSEMVLTTPALDARYDRAGARLVYTDLKGFEDDWRKHQQNSFARDIWLYEPASGRHTRLTDFAGEDRQPVFAPDERSLFFLSERSGTFNVWRLPLEGPGEAAQVTSHQSHPVRFLSVSDRGDLCYAFDGDLWLRPAGAAESARITVEIAADDPRLTPAAPAPRRT